MPTNPYAVTPSTYAPRANRLLLVYDQNNALVDVPESDIESIVVQNVLNGGSGQGTLTFRRRFNDIGALGYNYSFRLWVWPYGTTRPTDPYWTGHQEDPDQVQLGASGQCIVTAYGDFTYLNDQLVSLECNPGVGGNPSMDCLQLLQTLFAQYNPPGWLSPQILDATGGAATTLFPQLPVTYTHQGFADVIDDLLKQGRDSTGLLYTWRVKTYADGTRRVIIQTDQNPNVLDGTSGKTKVFFRHLFANSDFDQYTISNKYRDIANVVAVYGAKDPQTGVQAFGVYSDATSIQNLNRIKEAAINVPALATSDACRAYGQVWLDMNAYPSAEGSCRLFQPDPTIDAGTWTQFWEAPADANDVASIKQVRITQVDLTIAKSNRIEQVVHSTSPVPYLDKAIYRVGAEIQTQTQISNVPLAVGKQTMYIRSGGVLSSSTSSPAKVALTACQAVFPTSGGNDSKIVRPGALALTAVTDTTDKGAAIATVQGGGSSAGATLFTVSDATKFYKGQPINMSASLNDPLIVLKVDLTHNQITTTTPAANAHGSGTNIYATTNGQTGDGNYTVSVIATGSWVITKGDRPANGKNAAGNLQQNVLGVYVAGGIPFCVDLRMLPGFPAFTDELPALALAGGHSVLVNPPANDGSGSVNVGLDFWLDSTSWTNTNHRLSYFEVGAVPHGTSSTLLSTYQKVIPTSDGHLTPVIGALGCGSTYDFYVVAFDNLDRPTQALLLTTYTVTPLRAGSVDVDTSLAAPVVSGNGSITNIPDPVDIGHPHPTQADISVAPQITNIPTNGSVTGVLFLHREHGTTPWVPDGVIDVSGMPTPPASQTISYVYGLRACGKKYDFAVSFVSLGGYGLQPTQITQFGTSSQITNGFAARALVVTGPYLDNGNPVTPAIAGTQVATLNEPSGSNPGDQTFTANDVTPLVVGQAINIGGNDPLVIDSINTGAETFHTTTGAAHSHTNGASITAALVWNGESANGISAEVNLQFDVTNVPTDGTCARGLIWYRRHNSHAAKWSFAGGFAAPGKLTSPETYPATASIFFGIADLVNGDVYDFAFSWQATSGRESNKTVIISGFTALTLVVPTSSLPAMPPGTSVSGSGAVTGYSSVLGGTYHAAFTVTPSVTSSASFSSWGGGFRILAKNNDTGSLDTDTVRSHYFVACDIKNPTWTAGSLSDLTVGLSAGHAFQLAIVALDQSEHESALVAGGIFALTVAQQIGAGTIVDGPNLVADPGFELAKLDAHGKATKVPGWALYIPITNVGTDGTPPVCILKSSAKGHHAFVILSDAHGAGQGGSGINFQAMSEAMHLQANVEYVVSAYIEASHATIGAGTGAPSVSIISHDAGNAVTTLNEPSGSNPGDQTIIVTSAASLSVGDVIFMVTSNNRDTAQITAKAGTTLTLSHKLQYAHPNGTTISKAFSWDPALNDPSQPGYAPQTGLVRAEATQAFGGADVVWQTYTPTQDEMVSVLFQSHGAKCNGSGDGLIAFAIPMLQVGSAPGPFNQGSGKKKGPRPNSTQAATWTTSDGPVDTQNNADPGSGGGYVDHQAASWQSRAVITQTTDANGSNVATGQLYNYHTASMPAAIKSAGPNITGTPTFVRTVMPGASHQLSVSFVESDFGAIPPWIRSLFMVWRINGQTNHLHERRIDPGSLTYGSGTGSGSATISVPLGQSIDIGFYYTDCFGAKSTTFWPSALQNIVDPNGLFIDTITGFALHARAPQSVQNALDVSGNSKIVEFPGTIVDRTTGALTGFSASGTTVSTQQFALPTGTTITISGDIALSATTSIAQLILGTNVNGYAIRWATTGNMNIVKWVTGAATGLGTAVPVTQDTNYHSYKITIKVLGASSNSIEGSIDGHYFPPVVDTALDLTTGLWGITAQAGSTNTTGKVLHFRCSVELPHHQGMSAGVQTALDNAGNFLLTNYPNGKIQATDGSLLLPAGQNKSRTTWPLASGQPFHAHATLTAASGHTQRMTIGDATANGYGIVWTSGGLVELFYYSGGIATQIGSSFGTIAQDGNPHTFSITVTPGSPNTIEISIDAVKSGQQTDSHVTLTTGTWPVTINVDTVTSTLIHMAVSGAAKHLSESHVAVQQGAVLGYHRNFIPDSSFKLPGIPTSLGGGVFSYANGFWNVPGIFTHGQVEGPTPYAGANGANAWVFRNTSGAPNNLFAQVQSNYSGFAGLFAITPGQNTFSCYIDASGATSGTIVATLVDAGTAMTLVTLTQQAGQAGRISVSFSGISSTAYIAFVVNATFATGGVVAFAIPQLEPGVNATAYTEGTLSTIYGYIPYGGVHTAFSTAIRTDGSLANTTYFGTFGGQSLDNGVTNANLFTFSRGLVVRGVVRGSAGSAQAPVPPNYTIAGAARPDTTHTVSGTVTAGGASTTLTFTNDGVFANAKFLCLIWDITAGTYSTFINPSAVAANSVTFPSVNGHEYGYFFYGI